MNPNCFTDRPGCTLSTAHDHDPSHISTYPVGLLADLKHRRKLQTIINHVRDDIERRNWRGLRNYFNGYLAEWHYPPEGMLHYRCGKGWTRRTSLRRLGQHIIESNTPELATKKPVGRVRRWINAHRLRAALKARDRHPQGSPEWTEAAARVQHVVARILK